MLYYVLNHSLSEYSIVIITDKNNRNFYPSGQTSNINYSFKLSMLANDYGKSVHSPHLDLGKHHMWNVGETPQYKASVDHSSIVAGLYV